MTLRTNKHGSALLVLLAAIAILMLLYSIDLTRLFGPAGRTAPRGIEERPWLLEELLAVEGQPVKLPKSPKPTLREPIVLAGTVSRNDQSRGTVRIGIGTNGRVQAAWQAHYTHPPKTYRVEATAEGNIDISQTYQDADGADKSRLFFIARGAYRMLTDDAQQAVQSEEHGEVWLLGYLRPDGRADGTLTLTTDREWAAVYAYSAVGTEEP